MPAVPRTHITLYAETILAPTGFIASIRQSTRGQSLELLLLYLPLYNYTGIQLVVLACAPSYMPVAVYVPVVSSGPNQLVKPLGLMALSALALLVQHSNRLRNFGLDTSPLNVALGLQLGHCFPVYRLQFYVKVASVRE
ncbi:hypothetical protein MKEN_00545700 [Mycena kentingensis (nom. inval.)]|nr:hypothetical protein MKEN_00545700 [Mycena kentingensis (nom. inval.)]